MRFEFASATRIIFGPGTISEIVPLAAKMGHCAFVTTGSSLERAQSLLELLKKKEIEYVPFSVSGEPTIEIALTGLKLARNAKCDFVIGIGGGSVLDSGKVVAALLTNGGEPLDYLEVIGNGKPLTHASAPYIAIPTTAGTGSEVTRNAVLASPEHCVKVSIRSPLMLPSLAVVDPELTYSMPPSVTASTGLDAFTQLLEPFVSKKSNPLTDGICLEGLKRITRSLRRAYENGSDRIAREDMALASMFGGLALANAKLGAVHGIAGPVGGMFSAPHGNICARLLPYVMEANFKALKERLPDSPSLKRYDEVARILTGKLTAKAADGISFVQNLCEILKVPPLAQFGLTDEYIPTILDKSRKASSMKGNPVEITDEELTEVLKKSL